MRAFPPRNCSSAPGKAGDCLPTDGQVHRDSDRATGRLVKVIANVAVGFDNVDVPAATAQGILVTNTPDVLTETTADFAWALLMAAARRVVEGHAFVHSGEWSGGPST